jgi:DNA-directed RNA polymerase specialized sigma subunit
VAGLGKKSSRVRAGKKEAAGIDAIETWLLWASRLKGEMVRSQLPLLVRAIESQTGRSVAAIPGAALRELCEIGLEALIDAADRFDPFKGGRLAAPAGIALSRAVSQWLRHGREELGPVGRATARVDLDQLALPDWTRRVHPWQEWLEAPAGVREKLHELGEKERRAVAMRFGWEGPPRMVEDVARELGTTPTRVAAMQRRAVAMLAYGTPAKKARPRRKGAA